MVISQTEQTPIKLYYFEFFILILGVIMVVISLKIIISRRGVHTNLLLVVVSTFIYAFFYIMARSVVILYELQLLPVNAQKVDVILLIASMYNFFTLYYVPSTFVSAFFERSAATYFLVDYEKTVRLYIPFLCILCNTVMSCLCSTVLTFQLSSIIIVTAFLISIISLACIGFLYILCYNQKLLKNLEKSSCSDQYTLSKKFQLHENMRVFHLFKLLVPSMGIMISSIMSLEFWLSNSSDYSWIQAELFEILKDSLIPVVSFSVLISYDKWRTVFLPRQLNLRLKLSNSTVEDNRATGDVYFHIFNNSWK